MLVFRISIKIGFFFRRRYIRKSIPADSNKQYPTLPSFTVRLGVTSARDYLSLLFPRTLRMHIMIKTNKPPPPHASTCSRAVRKYIFLSFEGITLLETVSNNWYILPRHNLSGGGYKSNWLLTISCSDTRHVHVSLGRNHSVHPNRNGNYHLC